MQESMHDAASELRARSKLVVNVKRIIVARKTSKCENIIGRDRAADHVTLTDAKLVEAIAHESVPSDISPSIKPPDRQLGVHHNCNYARAGRNCLIEVKWGAQPHC